MDERDTGRRIAPDLLRAIEGEREPLTLNEICDVTGHDREAVRFSIRRLVRQELVAKHRAPQMGRGRATRYGKAGQ